MQNANPQPADPRPGVDFYIDAQGRWVWLSAYHLRRGTCCGSKCRNCPFDWKSVDPREIDPNEPRPPRDG